MFTKGIYKDSHPQNQPERSYRDSLNASLTRYEGAISQEYPTRLIDSIPEGFTVIGDTPLSDNTNILFSVGGDGEVSKGTTSLTVTNGTGSSEGNARSTISPITSIPSTGQYAETTFSIDYEVNDPLVVNQGILEFSFGGISDMDVSLSWPITAQEIILNLIEPFNSHPSNIDSWEMSISNLPTIIGGNLSTVTLYIKALQQGGGVWNTYIPSGTGTTSSGSGTLSLIDSGYTSGGEDTDNYIGDVTVVVDYGVSSNHNLPIYGSMSKVDIVNEVYDILIGIPTIVSDFDVIRNISDPNNPYIIVEAYDAGNQYNHSISTIINPSLDIPNPLLSIQFTPGFTISNWPSGITISSGGLYPDIPIAPIDTELSANVVASLISSAINSQTTDFPWSGLSSTVSNNRIYIETNDATNEYNNISVFVLGGDTGVTVEGGIISGGGVPQYDSEIGLVKDESYTTILKDSSINGRLGFDPNYPIDATSKTDPQGRKVLYWTDGLNPVRRFVIPQGGSGVISGLIDIDELSITPYLSNMPILEEPFVHNTGGILKTGVYQVAIRLVDNEGFRTPFILWSNPITIAGNKGANGLEMGAENDQGSSKSLGIGITNIPSDYSKVEVALIKETEVRLIPEYAISNDGSAFFRISGGEQYIPSSLDEVIIDRSNYSSAKTLTQQDGVLYLGGLSSPNEIGYQRFANDIKITAVADPFYNYTASQVLNKENSFTISTGSSLDTRDDLTAYRSGFKRGEVYAFYISLILKDGSRTRAFHIPGRPPIGNEANEADFSNVSPSKRFQVETFLIDPETNMGYWENENETYPTTSDFISASGTVDLRGLPVRHHHFPDNQKDPALEIGPDDSMIARPMGIRVDNVVIPPELQDEVIGWEIHYAKREEGNSRWVDQSPMAPNNYINVWGGLENLDTIAPMKNTFDPFEARSRNSLWPFTMLRDQSNTDIPSYVKKVATSGWVGQAFGEGNTDYITFGALDYNYSTNINERSDITWSGYIGMNSRTRVGTTNRLLYNDIGSEALIIEVSSPWATNLDIVDIVSDIRDVYNSFQNQRLVSTGYVGLSNESSSRHSIYGGDTYISYVAHILTLPGMGGLTVKGANYLIQAVVESTDNISLRHQGELEEEGFWPGSYTVNTLKEDVLFKTFDIGGEGMLESVNYLGYNDYYSELNELKPSFPYNPSEIIIHDFPNRIARSMGPDLSLQTDNFRVFLENDYLDISTQRGDIVKLSSLNNMILIHCLRGLFRTMGREELTTGDFRAWVGIGDIFAQPPQEIFSIDQGYGGISDIRHAKSSQFGYFFIDDVAGKIFSLSDGLEEISSIGLRKYFDDALDKGDYRIGVDPENNKVYFKKLGGFTISYLPNRKIWESFHSGNPYYYFWNTRVLLSIAENHIFTRSLNSKAMGTEGVYYNNKEDFMIEIVDNENPLDNKVTQSVLIDSIFLYPDETITPSLDSPEVVKEHFTTVRVYNDHQDSGVVPIVYFTEPKGNARRTNRMWKINGLRSISSPPTYGGQLPSWNKRRLVGKYQNIRLTYRKDNNPAIPVLFFVKTLKTPSLR